MKKIRLIFLLSLVATLLLSCGKDNSQTIHKEEPNLPIEKEEEDLSIDKEDIDLPINKEEPDLPKDKEDINLPIDKENIDLPIDKEGSSVSALNERIVYKDDLYNFSLDLPLSWEGKYTVERETWIDEINDSISFNFKEDDIFNNIFTIVIMDEAISEEEWGELFLIYITAEDGKTFSYLNIMEPTEELLEEENKSKLETVTEMVEAVPKIIESFKVE